MVTDTQTHRQTDTQTDGHGDSMTESAQWGQFSETSLGLNMPKQFVTRPKVSCDNAVCTPVFLNSPPGLRLSACLSEKQSAVRHHNC